ncbi:Chemotaxis response regulator protein-glutamate methylesterase [Planctomycetes bacterium Pan216]|uniref:Protein-glutamate methylesterase/protein-glutamine glutaminase n=1 Tax=Kolteria novifilia TaxID=2527975 RepID=A0A518BCN5_9BACT|nr:Chemotaxis response regulator protein-glutamate methylesterase [Planctomycetes bacterium Pan216]
MVVAPTKLKVRVLVVDDSALMRRYISGMVESDPRIDVCGIAESGVEAIEKAKQLRPDVVTLDVDMPRMNGVETIPALLDVHQVPIIMFSSLTSKGAKTTLQALEAGAIDFMPKPTIRMARDVQLVREELVGKILAVSGTKPIRRARVASTPAPTRPTAPSGSVQASQQLVVTLGISTGGPPALHDVLGALRPPFPPIAIVQHMPPAFTGPFAQRLDSMCPFTVKEAEDGDPLEPNKVYIAPGGRHMEMKTFARKTLLRVFDADPVSGHRPSVDVLFRSAAELLTRRVVGIIMTGMGHDGVEGCQAVLDKGGKTYGQDQASSAVYGMNKLAFKAGAVQEQFSLDQLAQIIMGLRP